MYEKGPPWLKFTDLLVAITNLLTNIYLHLCMGQRAEVHVSRIMYPEEFLTGGRNKCLQRGVVTTKVDSFFLL